MKYKRICTDADNRPHVKEGDFELFDVNVQTESHSVYFSSKIGAPNLVKKISHQIDELEAHFMHYLFGDNFYETVINSTKNQLQIKFAAYLEDSFYQEKIKSFSEIGVKYLSSQNEKQNTECVNICITKDNMGLPLRLTINLPTKFHANSFNFDLSEFEKEKERIIKHHLTYTKAYNSVFQEIGTIAEKLPESSDAIRLQLLNDFNKKWEGQLRFTYEINQNARTGEAKVTDASGAIISRSSSNHIKIDSTSFVDNPHETLMHPLSLARVESTFEHNRNATQSRYPQHQYNLRSTSKRKVLENASEQPKPHKNW